nr:uncharacterized protein LOC117275706 [Nicotiana tomentosiformis]
MRGQFEHLQQGRMSVPVYEMRFTEQYCHVAFLIPTKFEKVMRFIKGLKFGIKISMAREVETSTTFLQAVDIMRRIESIWGQGREDMVARGKKPRYSGSSSGTSSGGRDHSGRYHPSRPIPSACQPARGDLVQSSLSALPAQSSYHAPSAQGSFVGTQVIRGSLRFSSHSQLEVVLSMESYGTSRGIALDVVEVQHNRVLR